MGLNSMQETGTQASLAHFVSPTGTMDVTNAAQFNTSSGTEQSAETQLQYPLPDGQELANVPRNVTDLPPREPQDTVQSSMTASFQLGYNTQASLARMSTPDIPTGQLLDLDTHKIKQLGAAHKPNPRMLGSYPCMERNHMGDIPSETTLTTATSHDATVEHEAFPPASAGQVQGSIDISGAPFPSIF